MSSITVVEAPSQRTSGRRPRLSDEDFQDLYNAVKEGHWASDNESVSSQSAAYQRAQTAVKVIGERFKLTAIKTHVAPMNPEALRSVTERARAQTNDLKQIATLVAENYTEGYRWAIGPQSDLSKPKESDGK